MKKAYRNSSAGRLGSAFPRRLAQGQVIDRTKTKRGGKSVALIAAPSALARFFLPVGGEHVDR